MSIIDLDQILPESIAIRLGGREWEVPAAVSVRWVLETQRIWARAVKGDGRALIALERRLRDLVADQAATGWGLVRWWRRRRIARQVKIPALRLIDIYARLFAAWRGDTGDGEGEAGAAAGQ